MTTVVIPPVNPATGVTGTAIRPITEGVRVQATETTKDSGGLFGWLDNLGETVGDVLGRAADVAGEGFIDKTRRKFGPEASPDTAGVPYVGAGDPPTGFLQKNSTYILVGAGLLLAAFVVYKAR